MKKRLFISFYFLLSIAIFSQPYFVKNSSEISSIQSKLVPGDTVIMQNGVWLNQNISLTAKGAEGDSIVLMAETQGHVILAGTSTLNFSGKYLKIDGLRFIGKKENSNEIIGFRVGSSKAYNSRVTNCSIVDYNPSSKDTEYKWVSIYGTNNRVDHCYFKGKSHAGTTLVVWIPDSGEQVFHRIDHNFFGERPPLGVNGGETIRIGTSDYSMSDASCIVDYNYFYRCDGEVEIISNKTGDNIFNGNTFVECQGALTLRHGNGSTVKNNFFFGNRRDSTGGIRIIGEDHKVYNNYLQGLYGDGFYGALTIMNGVPNSPLNRYFQVKNAFVGFNTVVDCKASIQIGFGADAERSLPPIDCTISNNLINSEGFTAISLIDTPITSLYEGNIFWASSLGVDSLAGVQFTNPNMVLGSDSLWRINGSSAAYNSALGNYPEVISDFDGQLRTDPKDVGADEFSIDPIIYRPITPTEVGPVWLNSSVPVGVSVLTIGTGSVSFDPPGGIYDVGTTIQMTAVPGVGSTFDSWSGGITSTENPLTITINGPIEIIANFIDPNYYKYTLFKTGLGNVIVSPNLTEFPEGSSAIFTAVPAEGWQFKNWNGSLLGTENPDTLVFDSNENIQVVFEKITSVLEDQLPTQFKLNQNYPNPFNPNTQISYSLKESNNTKLKIYNVLGNEIASLVDEFKERGNYQLNYDASNLPSGVYFLSLEAGSFRDVKKMILSK